MTRTNKKKMEARYRQKPIAAYPLAWFHAAEVSARSGDWIQVAEHGGHASAGTKMLKLGRFRMALHESLYGTTSNWPEIAKRIRQGETLTFRRRRLNAALMGRESWLVEVNWKPGGEAISESTFAQLVALTGMRERLA